MWRLPWHGKIPMNKYFSSEQAQGSEKSFDHHKPEQILICEVSRANIP